MRIHLGRRGRDRMVFGFTTTHAISDYHQQSYEFEPCSWRGVLETTLGDKVCQWLPTSRRFSPGAPVSSANNTDRHDIAEILLKVALNTITLTLYIGKSYLYVYLIKFFSFYFGQTENIICFFSSRKQFCIPTDSNIIIRT
jgi:hypothetical protein